MVNLIRRNHKILMVVVALTYFALIAAVSATYKPWAVAVMVLAPLAVFALSIGSDSAPASRFRPTKREVEAGLEHERRMADQTREQALAAGEARLQAHADILHRAEMKHSLLLDLHGDGSDLPPTEARRYATAVGEAEESLAYVKRGKGRPNMLTYHINRYSRAVNLMEALYQSRPKAAV